MSVGAAQASSIRVDDVDVDRRFPTGPGPVIFFQKKIVLHTIKHALDASNEYSDTYSYHAEYSIAWPRHYLYSDGVYIRAYCLYHVYRDMEKFGIISV